MNNRLAAILDDHLSTQCQDVLHCLRKRGFIDQKMATDLYAIGRLAARIHDLKQDGYQFEVEMVSFTSKYGRKGAFARYRFA